MSANTLHRSLCLLSCMCKFTVWWDERESNSHSSSYEDAASPLSYRPVISSSTMTHRPREAVYQSGYKLAFYTALPVGVTQPRTLTKRNLYQDTPTPVSITSPDKEGCQTPYRNYTDTIKLSYLRLLNFHS